MIVTDLDGTLLKDDKTISQFTMNTIKSLRDSGHIFVVATARPFRAVKKFLADVKIDAGIYHNGALLYIEDNKIDSYQIDNPLNIIKSIIGINPNIAIAVESDDVLYSNFDAEQFWPGTDFIYSKNDFKEVENKKADKIIVEITDKNEMDVYQNILPDDLYIQISENKIGMIMKKSATKSNGIDFIAKKYGIKNENIIAFGDDYNDIDMLTSVGIGICVENGLNIVKENADIICSSNEDDGVAKWLIENVIK